MLKVKPDRRQTVKWLAVFLLTTSITTAFYFAPWQPSARSLQPPIGLQDQEVTIYLPIIMIGCQVISARIELISRACNGTLANDNTHTPAISADGRYVAFSSLATNLTPATTTPNGNIFLFDRQAGFIKLVSIASNGDPANGQSIYPSISADGRFIAFWSLATNLVSNDVNGQPDIFVYDQQTELTTLISVASDGTQGNGGAGYLSALSADGHYLTFTSSANNLTIGDTNNQPDVFVHDRQTHQNTLVSLATNRTQGNASSDASAISADGRYITFVSSATNLVTGDTNNTGDIFVHDRQAGQTTRVSVSSSNLQANAGSYMPAISGDGRYIAFNSDASNLVAGDTNNSTDIFLHDRQTGQTTRVSTASDGSQSNNHSFNFDTNSYLSQDGRYIAFTSYADNLVSGDTNGSTDIFVHDHLTGQTTRQSVDVNGNQGQGNSFFPSLAANGSFVAFGSWADNLVSNDTNRIRDIFVAKLY